MHPLQWCFLVFSSPCVSYLQFVWKSVAWFCLVVPLAVRLEQRSLTPEQAHDMEVLVTSLFGPRTKWLEEEILGEVSQPPGQTDSPLLPCGFHVAYKSSSNLHCHNNTDISSCFKYEIRRIPKHKWMREPGMAPGTPPFTRRVFGVCARV